MRRHTHRPGKVKPGQVRSGEGRRLWLDRPVAVSVSVSVAHREKQPWCAMPVDGGEVLGHEGVLVTARPEIGFRANHAHVDRLTTPHARTHKTPSQVRSVKATDSRP
jgi:hypothetical protein